jgi:xanthine/CO dehydrogenase XdhC/CoxF family maturation factor
MTKTPADIRALARAQTRLAIRTLTGICGSQAAPAAARVSAAQALLDRGWGRPAQTHTGEDCGGPIQVILRRITDAEESRLPLIDLTPDRGSR